MINKTKNKLFNVCGIFVLCLLVFAEVNASTEDQPEKIFDLILKKNMVMPGRQVALSAVLESDTSFSEPEFPFMEGVLVSYKGHSIGKTDTGKELQVYNYRVTPLKEGVFRIGPLEMEREGVKYISNAVDLEVARDIPELTHDEPAVTGEDKGPTRLEDHIFLEVGLPSRIYVDQLAKVEVKFYTDWLDVEGLVITDNDDGKIIQDKYVPGQTTIVKKDGVNYAVLKFSKTFFVPEAGKIIFGPVKARFTVVSLKDDPLNPDTGFYERLLARSDKKDITIESGEFELTVDPLPEKGIPSGFKGAVGDFKVSMDIEPEEVSVGDVLEMTVRVSGTGNFKTVNAPSLISSDGISPYEPNITRYDDHVIIRQILRVESADLRIIRGVEFSFFDPDTKAYRTVETRAVSLKVKETITPDEKGMATQILDKEKNVPGASAETAETEEPGTEIVRGLIGIKEGPVRTVSGKGNGINKVLLYILFAIPMAGLIILYFITKRLDMLKNDKAYAGWYYAQGRSAEDLSKAKKLLNRRDPERFYDHTFRLVQQYLGSRFFVEPGSITEDNALEMLSGKIDAHDVLDDLKDIFEDCHGANYTETEYSYEDMVVTYKKVKKVIEYLNAARDLL